MPVMQGGRGAHRMPFRSADGEKAKSIAYDTERPGLITGSVPAARASRAAGEGVDVDRLERP